MNDLTLKMYLIMMSFKLVYATSNKNCDGTKGKIV